MSNGVFVVVNGSSASGKTRLSAGIERVGRESAVLRGLRCARRTTTRALRDRESLPTEHRHIDPAAFELEVQSGSLDVHWRRPLSSGHEIRYGFSLQAERARGGPLPPADHLIPNDAQFEPFAECELLRLLAAFEFSSVQAGDDRGELPAQAAS